MPDPTPRRIAANIKQIRETRGLTQEQLAKASDVPRTTWTYLESGGANPTIAVLMKAAAALQVTVEELIGPPRSECRLIKAPDVTTVRRGAAAIRKLLPEAHGAVELDRFELPAKARMAGVPHRSGTREYLTCERGVVELAVAGETWKVEPGDVLSFRGDQKHSYANPGEVKAVAYSIVLLA